VYGWRGGKVRGGGGRVCDIRNCMEGRWELV
jgi:hypothetical protein